MLLLLLNHRLALAAILPASGSTAKAPAPTLMRKRSCSTYVLKPAWIFSDGQPSQGIRSYKELQNKVFPFEFCKFLVGSVELPLFSQVVADRCTPLATPPPVALPA